MLRRICSTTRTNAFAIAASKRYFGESGKGESAGAKAFDNQLGKEDFSFASKYADVQAQLTPEALKLLRTVLTEFQPRQDKLLLRRLEPSYFDFRDVEKPADPRRRKLREDTPKDLLNRKIELTGPVSDPTMAINALNSRENGIACYMGDAEDASTCSVCNTVGTLSVNYHIARRSLTATKKSADGTSKEYKLNPETATYHFRVPNLHLPLPSVLLNGEPVSAFLFHATMYAHHNAKKLIENGTGPYLYVPKLEGKEEAKFVDDALSRIEAGCGLPRGTIKVTVLVETWRTLIELPGVIEAMLDSGRIVGINAARWDYLASLHKHFGSKMVFPPRKDLTMAQPFMVAYVKRLVQTAHHYGIHAIGGMSAFIPSKDAEQNQKAMENARKDKERECAAGLDGAWIAHPGMADIRSVFDKTIRGANQVNETPDGVPPTVEELSPRFENVKITKGDVEYNVEVALEYLAAFMAGKGAVALHGLMEDAATMEISRYNMWNHVHKKAKLDTGDVVTLEMIKDIAAATLKRLKSGQTQVPYATDYFDDAWKITLDAVQSDTPPTFLTLPAMEVVNERDVGKRIGLDLRRPRA